MAATASATSLSSYQLEDVSRKRQRPPELWVRTRVVIDRPLLSPPRTVPDDHKAEEEVAQAAQRLLRELEDEEAEWTGIVSRSQQDAKLPPQFKHLIEERWHDISNLIEGISGLLSAAPSKRPKVERPIVVIPGFNESELGLNMGDNANTDEQQRDVRNTSCRSSSSSSEYEDRDDYSADESREAAEETGDYSCNEAAPAATSTRANKSSKTSDTPSSSPCAEDAVSLVNSDSSSSNGRLAAAEAEDVNSAHVVDISDDSSSSDDDAVDEQYILPRDLPVQHARRDGTLPAEQEEADDDDDSVSTASATPPPRLVAVGKASKRSTPQTFLRRLSRRVVASLQSLQP